MKGINKRKYKINPDCLFEAVKTRKELELYCFHLNLHSLSRNKSIHNYKEKTKFLSNKTGFPQRKVKELIKKSIEKGFLTIDFNPSHLRVASKLFTLKYFNKEITGDKMPKWAAKFITIETNENITIDILKALTIKIKQNQKSFAYIKNLVDQKDIKKKNTSNSKIKMAQLKCFEKEHFKNLASFDVNIFLYLQDIKELFGYADNSGASKLLHSLQDKKLLTIHQQEKFLRHKRDHRDFINSEFSKKTFCKNNSFFEQQPNLLEFTLPFDFKEHVFVEFNNNCFKQIIKKKNSDRKKSLKIIQQARKKLREGKYDQPNQFIVKKKLVKKKKKQTKPPVHILELIRNSKGENCGEFMFSKYKGRRYNLNFELRKIVDLGGTIDVFEINKENGELTFLKTKGIRQKYFNAFDFIVGQRRISCTKENHLNILKSCDIYNPNQKKKTISVKKFAQD